MTRVGCGLWLQRNLLKREYEELVTEADLSRPGPPDWEQLNWLNYSVTERWTGESAKRVLQDLAVIYNDTRILIGASYFKGSAGERTAFVRTPLVEWVDSPFHARLLGHFMQLGQPRMDSEKLVEPERLAVMSDACEEAVEHYRRGRERKALKVLGGNEREWRMLDDDWARTVAKTGAILGQVAGFYLMQPHAETKLVATREYV